MDDVIKVVIQNDSKIDYISWLALIISVLSFIYTINSNKLKVHYINSNPIKVDSIQFQGAEPLSCGNRTYNFKIGILNRSKFNIAIYQIVLKDESGKICTSPYFQTKDTLDTSEAIINNGAECYPLTKNYASIPARSYVELDCLKIVPEEKQKLFLTFYTLKISKIDTIRSFFKEYKGDRISVLLGKTKMNPTPKVIQFTYEL